MVAIVKAIPFVFTALYLYQYSGLSKHIRERETDWLTD